MARARTARSARSPCLPAHFFRCRARTSRQSLPPSPLLRAFPRMTAAFARALMALAARCLGTDRYEWGLAMEAEFEAAVEDGNQFAFATGCLIAAVISAVTVTLLFFAGVLMLDLSSFVLQAIELGMELAAIAAAARWQATLRSDGPTELVVP